MAELKTIVLGLGNSLMSDDAIGLMVVERLAQENRDSRLFSGMEFKTSEKVGLNLIELLQGYEQAVIIDTIITGKHHPGEIIEFSLDQLPSNPRLRCPHDADFKSAIELARKTGLKMPEKVIILGIEVLDNLTFSPELSPQLAKLFPSIIKKIIQKLDTLPSLQ